ncbi:MAG: hypothetical protein ACO3JJ_00310 [Opitutaceae bacterium]
MVRCLMFAALFAPGGFAGTGAEREDVGQLKARSLYLEAADALLELAAKPDQAPVWRFPGIGPDEVEARLRRAGVEETQLAVLRRAEVRRVGSDGVALLPPVALLVEFRPEVRAAVYAELARSPLNPDHFGPLFLFGDPDAWLSGSELSAAQMDLVRRLRWQRGGHWRFSDVSALIQAARSAPEILAARRFMTRRQAWRLWLEPPARAQQEAFLRHWTADERHLDTRPLLAALVAGRAGDSLELALLLPPLARERLYTYPSLRDAVAGRLPDCNWTALNFLAARPETYYLDAQPAYLELTQNYREVAAPGHFGDVACFISPEGLVFHSCVVLGDGFVFTKNGEGLFAPWLIMPLRDVDAIYGDEGRRSVRYFRLKP